MTRALYLKGLCDAGLPLKLTFAQLYYIVLIRSFSAPIERVYQIPYRIVCEVLEDNTWLAAAAKPNVDDAIATDMAQANNQAAAIGDSKILSAMASLNSAISAVTTFAKATQATINSVLLPLNAVRSQVQTLITSVDNTLINVTTVGGILPNNPIAQNVAKLTAYVNASLQMPQLMGLNSVLGRMGTNLGQINSSSKTITVPGGNLFDLASKFYGDASKWTLLAKANKTTDPNLSGITTLVIPPANSTDDGGVLNA
jgi:nucleoid-associated protein YgaU